MTGNLDAYGLDYHKVTRPLRFDTGSILAISTN